MRTAAIRLHKRPPAGTLRTPKGVELLKFIYWTEEHRSPGMCRSCGHDGGSHGHNGAFGSHGVYYERPGCSVTDCRCAIGHVPPDVTSLERRGQFLSVGSRPRTVWVIPFAAAPWETGRAAAVELRVSDIRQRAPGEMQASIAA